MGKLYRVKIIHTLTGIFSAILFLLQLRSIQSFSFQIENFFTSLQTIIPCLGLIISLLFIFFKRTFMLPALLMGAIVLQIGFSPQDYHFLFLLVILILLTPYVVYFYKYRDFEIMLSGLKIIIPVSILILYYIQNDILEQLYPRLGFGFVVSAITFLLMSLVNKTRGLGTFCFVILSLFNCVLMYGLGKHTDVILQLFLLSAGVLSYNGGKSRIFEKISFNGIAKSPRSVVFSALILLLTIYLHEYDVRIIPENLQYPESTLSFFENVFLFSF